MITVVGLDTQKFVLINKIIYKVLYLVTAASLCYPVALGRQDCHPPAFIGLWDSSGQYEAEY